MVDYIECGIRPVDNTLSKNWKELSPDRQEYINKRIADFIARMKAVAASSTEVPSSTAHTKMPFQIALLHSNAWMAEQLPQNHRNLGYYMATLFGMEHNLIGLGDGYTDAGNVRRLLNKARKSGEGSLRDALAEIQLIDESLSTQKVFERVRRNHRINSDNAWQRFKMDAYEIGFMPYAQKDLGVVGAEGLAFMRGRQQRFMDKLIKYGITQNEADQMARAVQGLADKYMATREILSSFGVSVGDAGKFQNYLPRQFSAETIRRIGWNKNLDNFEIFGMDGVSEIISLNSAFTKARNSNHFIPEDLIVLDSIFTAAIPDIYKKMGVEDIHDLINNTGSLTKAFIDYFDKSHPSVLNALVETGLISKIPMTTTELADYMVARYELPFRVLNELVPTDFDRMSAVYRNQAEKMAGRSFIAQFTAQASDPLTQGWGVSEAQRLADSDAYKRYIKLLAKNPNENAVIPYQQAVRLGLNPDNPNMPGYLNQVHDVYVHPTVAELYRAQVSIFTDPNQMGIMARVIDDFTTIFNTTVLATSDFVFRQLYSPFIQTWAAGGRLDTFGTDVSRFLTSMARLRIQGKSLDSFVDTLDNTKKIYRGPGEGLLTERELYRLSMQTGFMEDIAPFMGATGRGVYYKPSANPMTAANRTARYLRDVVDRYPDLGLPKVIAETYKIANTGIRRITEDAFYSIGFFNHFFDTTARFSTLKSLLDTTGLNSLVRKTQGQFDGISTDFDAAVQRVNNYFFVYDNPAAFDEWMRHVRPFWMFYSRNTFAIFRMMVRNPGKFMAYQRLWAATNPYEEDVPEGGVRDWIKDQAPMYWYRRNEKGEVIEVIALPRAQIDPVASGLEEVSNIADVIRQQFGIWPDSQHPSEMRDRISDAPWDKTTTNRALRELVNSSHGWIKAIYGFATGEDPLTGRALRTPDDGMSHDTILGVEVPRMTKFMIQSLLPQVARLDRSNPNGIFGTPPRWEGTTRIDEGKPSWTGARRNPNSADFRTWWQRTSSAFGFNFYIFDVAEEMGFRETEVQFAVAEGYRSLNKKRLQIREITDPQEFNREIEKLRLMEAYHAALAIDYAELRAWREQRGLSHPSAIRLIRSGQVRQDAVQGLSEAERMMILQQVYGQNLQGGVDYLSPDQPLLLPSHQGNQESQ
jgi:hypothetical protein